LSRSGRKIVQYLNEARTAALGLRRDLQAQIALTPSGRYRTALERHLKETVRHAARLGDRLSELGETRGPLQASIDTAATLAAQILGIGKAPIEFVRGPGSEERILRNARDSCASEAHEIARYTALERLARDADDRPTAKLAAWIRADEEAMLKKILAEIPALTDAVARASFDVVAPKAIPRKAGTPAPRQPTGPTDRGSPNGAAGRAAISTGPRNLTTQLAPGLPEPWDGYDDLTAVEVIRALYGASEATVKRARSYERVARKRSTVIQATERELARS
jgi:ferritin-like metal-binding protein YciE